MKQNVATKVKLLLEEHINAKGFILWDITFGKEGGEMLLTVTVDNEKGDISLDMLSELNETINPILDENDPIEDAYSLMLESAGAERTLRTDAHINYAIDKKAKVELKLYKAVNGSKEFDGHIISYDGETIVFEAEIKETSKEKNKGKTVNKAKMNNVETEIKKETFNFERKAVSKMIAYV